MGDNIRRVPITGNDTVLDALSAVNGLSQVSSAKVWVARPAPGGFGCEQILPVDYAAITHGGSTATNYQIMPGDRVFVAGDSMIAVEQLADEGDGADRAVARHRLVGHLDRAEAGKPSAANTTEHDSSENQQQRCSGMTRWQWFARATAFSAVILAIAWLVERALVAESEFEYPRPCPGGCEPNGKTWGFNHSSGGDGPASRGRTKQSAAVISERFATPEGTREQPLPRAIPLQPYQQPMPQPPQARTQLESPQMQPLPAEPLPPQVPPKCPAGVPCPQGGTPAEGGTILPPEGGTILPSEGTIVPPAGTVMPATPPETKGKEPDQSRRSR